MSAADQLRQMAQEAAQNTYTKQTNLEQEITELENKISQKKAAMNLARNSLKRLPNFQVEFGGNYQCPYCWIESGRQSSLRAIGGGTKKENFFRCTSCDTLISIGI